MVSEAVPLGAACTWCGLPDEEAWLACQKELAISTAKDSGDPFQQPELEAMAASYPFSKQHSWGVASSGCLLHGLKLIVVECRFALGGFMLLEIRAQCPMLQ